MITREQPTSTSDDFPNPLAQRSQSPIDFIDELDTMGLELANNGQFFRMRRKRKRPREIARPIFSIFAIGSGAYPLGAGAGRGRPRQKSHADCESPLPGAFPGYGTRNPRTTLMGPFIRVPIK